MWRIKNRVVGDNQPVFIIAEAGVNHNGDVDIAHKLIDENKLQNGYKMILNGGIYQRVKHIHWHLLGGDNLESEVGN